MALMDHKDVTSSELLEKAAPLNGVNTAAQLIYQLVRVCQLSKVKTLFLELWYWFLCMLAMAPSCIECFVGLVWYMLFCPLPIVCISLTQNFRWYIIASIILFFVPPWIWPFIMWYTSVWTFVRSHAVELWRHAISICILIQMWRCINGK